MSHNEPSPVTAAGYRDPRDTAERLNILLEGAIVTARVVGQVSDGGRDPGAAARLAREMAADILDRA